MPRKKAPTDDTTEAAETTKDTVTVRILVDRTYFAGRFFSEGEIEVTPEAAERLIAGGFAE